MTVVAPRQPGCLFDGTAAFRVEPVGKRPAWPVLRRECHRLFPRGDVRRPGGATTFAAIHSCLQASARHWARTSPPSSTNLFAQGPWLPIAPSAGLNAHARTMIDRGDCPRHSGSQSLCSGDARNGACVCRMRIVRVDW
jgi:hypothetical protein